MDQDTALLYMTAARSDPFLAAYVAVLDEHLLGHSVPIHGDEWWASFQQFVNHGLVPDYMYVNLDVDRVFYRRARPKPTAVDGALFHVKRLRAMREDREDPMAGNGFKVFEENKGLERREDNGRNGNGHGLSHPLSGPRGFSVFAPEDPAPPLVRDRAHDHDLGLGANRERWETDARLARENMRQPGLPCVDPRPMDPRPYVEDWNPKFFCCDMTTPITFVQESIGDAHEGDPNDESPQNEIEFVYHGTCPVCNRRHHWTSVAPVSDEHYEG